MRESYWGYWLVILGVFVIGVMLLVNNITTNNTQDYYNVKEVTHNAMVDAIDFSYLRLYGNIKISESKFVENFYRRFAENVSGANEYDIDIYDVYEVPPKVSVQISSGTRRFNVGNSHNNSYDTVTTISSILELGVKGEGTPEGKKSTTRICTMDLTTELMKFFKEIKEKGYAIKVAEEVGLSMDDNQLKQLEEIKTFPEFKKWFNNEFIVEGKTAGEYLKSTKYSELNPVFKKFIEKGWIKIN